MKRSILVLLVLMIVSTAAIVVAQDKPNRRDQQPSFENAAEACEQAIEARRRELASEYSTAVFGLKQRLQRDGDLDKALALDEEWTRSIARKPLEPKDVVDFPVELNNLQNEYLKRFESVVVVVANDVLRDLEKEATRLAKSGSLDKGRVLKKEMDTIRKLYLSDQVPAEQHAKEAPAPVVEQDPVAECEALIRERREALHSQYLGELQAMERTFQSRGLLDDLVAAQAERNRFEDTPLVSEEKLVEGPADLRELQLKHLSLQKELVPAVVSEFASRLESRIKSLTIEGQLDEAKDLKTSLTRVRQQFAAVDEERSIDLLSHLISRKRWHAGKNGSGWRVSDGGIQMDMAPAVVNWLELPYVPPVEYDLNVRIVRVQGGGISLVGAKGTRRFNAGIGGAGDRVAGFEDVDGRGLGDGGNITMVNGPRGSLGQNGIAHCVTLRVRKNEVALLCDGELVSQLQTDYRNLSIGHWKPIASWQRKDTIGIRWYEIQSQIVGIDVVEVSGKGRLLD